MANIIPMAGEGSRYTVEGYKLPKPLIPVSGIPMVIKAIRSMPKSNKWIFIVRKEHIDDFKIDVLIKNEIPDAILIPISKTTEGQACTCLLAEPYLELDEEIFIAACDNAFIYDKQKYQSLKGKYDAIVWTFTKNETLKENPKAWGWCVLEDDNTTIKGMSIKKPISNDPYNDHAVVASFYFKRFENFKLSIEMMIKENFRINNEFYVDAIPLFLKKMNKNSSIFDVDLYVGWGTPSDLYYYQKLEYFFMNGITAKVKSEFGKDDIDKFDMWREYFTKRC